MNRGKFFIKCLLIGLLAVAVFGLVTMTLWNLLIPSLFNGPQINFWQALGLLLLSKILFWGFGGKKPHGYYGAYGKHRFYEKIASLTPEEREAFKQKMAEKWCRKPPGTPGNQTNTSAN